MLQWIKKYPFIPLFIGFLLVAGLIIYGIYITLFDPNYVEFGPIVAFFKAKNCAKPEKPEWSSGDCLFYARSISIFKNNPPILSQAVKTAIKEVRGKFNELNFDPLDPSQWICSVDGKLIDLAEKIQYKKTYKCWPK